jgi:hypothetical protein
MFFLTPDRREAWAMRPGPWAANRRKTALPGSKKPGLAIAKPGFKLCRN